MANDSGDTVPLQYISTLLRAAVEQGYDLEQTARSAGLPLALLAKKADPLQQVPAQYYSNVYRVIMRMLQDETLGISMKQPTPSGSFRMMALFVIHCKDLEQALTRAHEFQSFCRQVAGLPATKPMRCNPWTVTAFFMSCQTAMSTPLRIRIWPGTRLPIPWRYGGAFAVG